MPRLLTLLLALAAVVVWAARPAPAPPEPVNAVVGDAGFEAAFGRAPTATDAEGARLRTHLAYAEGALRARDVSALDPGARAARLRLLDTLAAYRRAGVFPRNTAAPGRTPVFIDGDGRICAVGRLVEASAGRAAAEAIAAAHRLDRIAEMPAAAVAPWAAAHGFSLAELAMIQPAYCGGEWGHRPGCPAPDEPVDERAEAAALVAGGLAAAANAALLAGDGRSRWVGAAGVAAGGGLVALGLSGDANWEGADLAVGGAALAAGLWQLLRPTPTAGPDVALAPVAVPGRRPGVGLAARWAL